MNEKTFPIHFIITGGTIDSHYDSKKDTAIPLKHSVIPKFVNNLNLYSKVKFTEVCMKDSRNLTREDLKKVLNKIEKSSEKHFIITHGTYTLPDTGRYLKANLKRKNIVVILTASMLPMAEFTMSDGGFNLGFAIAKLHNLPNGIYACMNGKVFSPEEIMKVISEGRFASIIGEK